MVRECPKCGTVSPPTAEQCDCGYEFATGRVTSPPVQRPPSSPVAWLLVPVGLMVGAVVGGTVCAMTSPVAELAVLWVFLLGAFWGTVVGGATGVVAAVVIRHRQRTGRP
jgi:hypothetical protein